MTSVVQTESNRARLNCRGAANTRGEISSEAPAEKGPISMLKDLVFSHLKVTKKRWGVQGKRREESFRTVLPQNCHRGASFIVYYFGYRPMSPVDFVVYFLGKFPIGELLSASDPCSVVYVLPTGKFLASGVLMH